MRIALFLAALVAASPANANYGEFCRGYESGYEAGYCYGQAYCTKPLRPMCPMMGLNERGYEDGYNRGFLAGLAERR